MEFVRELVFYYDLPDLLDLIGFTLCSTRLDVYDFLHTRPEKDVVASAYALVESKSSQQSNSARKGNVGVCVSTEDAIKSFLERSQDTLSLALDVGGSGHFCRMSRGAARVAA